MLSGLSELTQIERFDTYVGRSVTLPAHSSSTGVGPWVSNVSHALATSESPALSASMSEESERQIRLISIVLFAFYLRFI